MRELTRSIVSNRRGCPSYAALAITALGALVAGCSSDDNNGGSTDGGIESGGGSFHTGGARPSSGGALGVTGGHTGIGGSSSGTTTSLFTGGASAAGGSSSASTFITTGGAMAIGGATTMGGAGTAMGGMSAMAGATHSGGALSTGGFSGTFVALTGGSTGTSTASTSGGISTIGGGTATGGVGVVGGAPSSGGTKATGGGTSTSLGTGGGGTAATGGTKAFGGGSSTVGGASIGTGGGGVSSMGGNSAAGGTIATVGGTGAGGEAPDATVGPLRSLDVSLTGMTADVNHVMEFRVINANDELVTLGILDPLLLASYTFTLPMAIPDGMQRLDFFADVSGDRVYAATSTDEAWSRPIPAGPAPTINFAHNTNYTDISTPAYVPIGSNFTFHASGMTPHVGQRFELRVIVAESGQVVGLYQLGAVPAATFDITIPGIIANSGTYRIDFWADENENGRFDPPPTDHSWRMAGTGNTSGLAVSFAHNTDFTNVNF